MQSYYFVKHITICVQQTIMSNTIVVSTLLHIFICSHFRWLITPTKHVHNSVKNNQSKRWKLKKYLRFYTFNVVNQVIQQFLNIIWSSVFLRRCWPDYLYPEACNDHLLTPEIFSMHCIYCNTNIQTDNYQIYQLQYYI